MTDNPEVTGRRFITTKQLRVRWGGCSAMTVERRIKSDPTFPKPYHHLRVRLFDIADIETYERNAARELPVRSDRKSKKAVA